MTKAQIRQIEETLTSLEHDREHAVDEWAISKATGNKTTINKKAELIQIIVAQKAGIESVLRTLGYIASDIYDESNMHCIRVEVLKG